MNNLYTKINKLSLTNWLSKIEGNTKLSELAIPATHNSGSAYTCKNNKLLKRTSICQSEGIFAQLMSGVRYFDIRVRDNNYSLTIYHGLCPFWEELTSVLQYFNSFISSHPDEFIIINVLIEPVIKTNVSWFNRIFFSKKRENNIRELLLRNLRTYGVRLDIPGNPTVDQLRGNVWLDYDSSLNFEATSLCKVYQSGWKYKWNDKEEKIATVIEGIIAANNETKGIINHHVVYAKGGWILPNPKKIASFVNYHLIEYLDIETELHGIVQCDFMSEELCMFILKFNEKYEKKEE